MQPWEQRLARPCPAQAGGSTRKVAYSEAAADNRHMGGRFCECHGDEASVGSTIGVAQGNVAAVGCKVVELARRSESICLAQEKQEVKGSARIVLLTSKKKRKRLESQRLAALYIFLRNEVASALISLR